MTMRSKGFALGAMLIVGLGCGDEAPFDFALHCPPAAQASSDRAAYDQLLVCLQTEGIEAAHVDRAVDDFVQTVETQNGFPIFSPDGTEVTFFYVADARWDRDDDKSRTEDFKPERRLEPIRVFGVFNDEDIETGLVLERAAATVYHRTVPVSMVESAPWGYRFVARTESGGDAIFSDPLSRRFDFAFSGRRSLMRGSPDRSMTVNLRDVKATQLDNTRSVFMYLPPGYEQSSDRYPVLYMQDGRNLFTTNLPGIFAGTWAIHGVLDREIEAGNIEPLIVVGIDLNDDRLHEYAHVADACESGFSTRGQGDAYLDFVVNEVKPRIDAGFRTRPDRASTGIMGSSMGGLISYYAGLRYPEVFRYVGGMSSTFWIGDCEGRPTMIDLYRDADLAGRDQIFYVDTGGGPGEAGCGTSSGSDNYCSGVSMADALRGQGIDKEPTDINQWPMSPDVNLYYYWDEGAGHNEGAWRVRFHRALRLFFPAS